VVLDGQGIPVMRYAQGYFHNPTSISQFGLRHHALWLEAHRPEDRAKVLRAAKWLLANQARDGRWVYRFEYMVGKMGTSPGTRLTPPWSSAMAQGQAMSLLVRTWHLTRDDRYLEAARRAVRPLRVDVTRGGLARRLAGGPFLEEYPTTPPSHVLNGFMFTLLGLWDVSPWSPEAADLYRRSRRTLIRALPLYDRGQGQLSAYHLGFRPAGQPVHASIGYHELHRGQLRALHAIDPHPKLAAYRKRWRARPIASAATPVD
jgi:heparosan-N-sulfate-glucuronate 5-epimerase